MILRRDPCSYCGKRKPFDSMTVDHIEAKSKGNRRTGATNGAGACFTCNQSKADKSLLTFLARRLPRKRGQLEVRRHARRRSHAVLGTFPPRSWWTAVAKKIAGRSLRAIEVQAKGNKETAWWIVPVVSADGVPLDMLVQALSLRDEHGGTWRVEILDIDIRL